MSLYNTETEYGQEKIDVHIAIENKIQYIAKGLKKDYTNEELKEGWCRFYAEIVEVYYLNGWVDDIVNTRTQKINEKYGKNLKNWPNNKV